MRFCKNVATCFLFSATVIGVPLTAAAATPDDAHHVSSQLASRWGFPDPIEGLWNVKVYLMPCGAPQPAQPSFLAMAMFGRGGTFHDENNANPVNPPPPLSLRSEAFGQWEHVRGRTYKFAFQAYRFDAAGNFIGSQIVRHTVELARDGMSYTSEGAPEFFDAAGQPIQLPPPPAPRQCSTSTATRFN